MDDLFEMIAAQTADRIRAKLAVKLDDADVAVIRNAVASDLSKLREALGEMGYSIVPTASHPPVSGDSSEPPAQ